MFSQNMLIAPEALFTGACICWFGNFAVSDTPDPTGRSLLLVVEWCNYGRRVYLGDNTVNSNQR